MAHDFNNLLSAVLGNLKLLRKRPAGETAALRLLDGAIDGAERGAALTQRLLAFARQQDLRPAAIDAAELIRGMIEMLRRSIGPQIEVETRLRPISGRRSSTPTSSSSRSSISWSTLATPCPRAAG